MRTHRKRFRKLYLHLFNAVTDAIDALSDGRAEDAKALLIQAQQACEETYIAV